MFANMHVAYDTLSPTMQGMISNLTAVHDVANANHDASSAAVEHPVVQTHPETGRKALYVNSGFTSHIVGFEPPESTTLLDFLNRHSTRPENVYRHRWRVGDLVVWITAVRCITLFQTMTGQVHVTCTGQRHFAKCRCPSITMACGRLGIISWVGIVFGYLNY